MQDGRTRNHDVRKTQLPSSNGVSDSKNSSFSLPVKIFQEKYNAIIDSGSVFNCISDKLVQKLHLKIKPFENGEVKYARGVTGELIFCDGMCEVPLKFAGILCVTPMRVCTK